MIIQVHLYHCRIGIGFSYAEASLDQADALIVELVGYGQNGWGEVLLPKVEPLWDWALQVAPMLLGQDPRRLPFDNLGFSQIMRCIQMRA